MPARIVILGAGTGGTLTANRLRRRLETSEATITVIDQDERHVYQPGLLFVPFGLADAHDIVRPRSRQLVGNIRYIERAIDRVELGRDTVVLADGHEEPYDVLVVATGAELAPEETEGLTGPGWGSSAFTFYDLDGAVALRDALGRLEGGRLVVNVVDLPIKCPVAPLEFCFLADWYLQERGVRDQVELTYVTPLDGAFTKPVASAALAGLLEEKGVRMVTEFNTGEVAYADAGGTVSYGGNTYAPLSGGLQVQVGTTPVPGTTNFQTGGSATNGQVTTFTVAVPEPGALALAGIGLAVGGWWLSRRRR